MCADLTTLVDVLGKLGPLFISGAVAGVAYWQWQAANAKFVLELRNERMKIYKPIRNVVGGAIVAHGDVSHEVVREFEDATSEVKSWFGDEVVSHVEVLRITINKYHCSKGEYRVTESPGHGKTQANNRSAVVELYRGLEEIFMPYIRLSQKIH